jgi:hypothetical protein
MFASPGRLTFLCEAKSDCLWQWICLVDFAGIGTKRIHQTSSALIVNRILPSAFKIGGQAFQRELTP